MVYYISKTFSSLSLSLSLPMGLRILLRRDACRIASGISYILWDREVAPTRESGSLYSVSILVSRTVTREIFWQTCFTRNSYNSVDYAARRMQMDDVSIDFNDFIIFCFFDSLVTRWNYEALFNLQFNSTIN